MLQRWLAISAVALFTISSSFAQGSSSADDGIAHFGSDIVVHQGDPVRDVACFFCSVEADGDVGDVAVFFGNATLRGSAQDVAVFGGNTRLGGASSVDDVAVFGGHLLNVPGSVVRGSRAVFPPIVLLIPLLVLAFFVWLIVMLLRWLFTRNPRRVIYVAPRT